MRNVSGATAEEIRMIKAVQSVVGAIPDGSIGTQTLSDIARIVGAPCFPLAVTIYSQLVIIAKDCHPLAARGPLSQYANSISGSFSYNAAPCSILVSDGYIVHSESCHYWIDGTPESVIYKDENGIGIKRVRSASDLPVGTSWAVGGVGLLGNYDPAAEGFKGAYSDVLRKTAHTLLGVKDGWLYLAYVSNMTAAQVNDYALKLRLDAAIMLDGGHVAAINSAEKRINTAQTQYYVIQAR